MHDPAKLLREAAAYESIANTCALQAQADQCREYARALRVLAAS